MNNSMAAWVLFEKGIFVSLVDWDCFALLLQKDENGIISDLVDSDLRLLFRT